MTSRLCVCVCLQDLDNEVKDQYATVEQLIEQKAGGVADAKRRAQALQQEAKELLLKASDKLRLLKGKGDVARAFPPLLCSAGPEPLGAPQIWRSPTPTTSGLWR